MDDAFAALTAIQDLLSRRKVGQLSARLQAGPPTGSDDAVEALTRELSAWSTLLNERWRAQQAAGDYRAAGETADALSRISGWWIYVNQGIVRAIDGSADVAGAIRRIGEATDDLTAARNGFAEGTSSLGRVADILDGLFEFVKSVAT